MSYWICACNENHKECFRSFLKMRSVNSSDSNICAHHSFYNLSCELVQWSLNQCCKMLCISQKDCSCIATTWATSYWCPWTYPEEQSGWGWQQIAIHAFLDFDLMREWYSLILWGPVLVTCWVFFVFWFCFFYRTNSTDFFQFATQLG